MKRRSRWNGCQEASTAPFGADNVFAVEALAHGDAGLAGLTIVGMDGLEAAALLGDVEDVAGFRPGWRDLRREARLVGEEEGRLHQIRLTHGPRPTARRRDAGHPGVYFLRTQADGLAAPDKSLEMVPGAHYFEDTPGSREAVADLMAGWIESRL